MSCDDAPSFPSRCSPCPPPPWHSSPGTTPPWRGSGPPRTAAERDERHRWLEENWESLPPDQRGQVEERFGRGVGPQGMNPDDMRMRWQAMTPRQRQELMYGPGGGMGRGPGMRQGMGPPPAPPPQPRGGQ